MSIACICCMCRLTVISALIYIVEECLCLFKFALDIYVYQSMIVSSGMTRPGWLGMLQSGFRTVWF
jgi:hypothetical protein